MSKRYFSILWNNAFLSIPITLCICLHAQVYGQEVVINTETSLRGISVLNSKVIWVSGSKGVIAKTENGGETWENLKIPNTENFEFRDVEVFSKNEVLVMSAGTGEESNIYRTEDGGDTWQCVYANTYPTGFFNGFSFKDDLNGVLTGDPVDGKLFVIETSDGGKTWTRPATDQLVDLVAGEIGGFSASGSHLFYGYDLFINGTGGTSSRMHLTDNELRIWKAVETPIVQGQDSQGVFSIDFCNAQTGVAIGGDYTQESIAGNNVILTRDSGETWQLAEMFPVYQSSVRYVNCDQLISIGPKGTYQSNDGGKTWSKMNLSGYHTLDIGGDSSIWAAGSEGRIVQIKLTVDE